MADDVQQLPTLTDDDRAAVQRWVQAQGLGSAVTDVEPLTGGTQNIVVRLHIDGRPMVLRRPPLHPRPTSNKTMLREMAALRTLAGTNVPHPAFIAGTDDLDVHGDPHLSNVLLRRDKPELAAFVDWEMCTVGDPLLDLGWMLICWPLETNTIIAGAQLAALGGLASRRELLDAYLAAGGRETSS